METIVQSKINEPQKNIERGNKTKHEKTIEEQPQKSVRRV